MAGKLHQFVERGMKEWEITGLAVAVVKDDKVVFARGYGVRDVRTGKPIDKHTVFQIGSCTKPLTATALAHLVHRAKLKWDTPIRDYWAGFRLHDENAARQATAGRFCAAKEVNQRNRVRC